MPDPRQRLMRGQRLQSLPNEAWNANLETIDDLRRRNALGQQDSPDELANGTTITVRNDTGTNLLPFSVVALSTPMISPADNLGEVADRPNLIATIPVGDEAVFAITQDPIPHGELGRARLAGATYARVNVVNPTFVFGTPAAGITNYLNSSLSGGVRIMWIESGTGLKWALVRFGADKSIIYRPQCNATTNRLVGKVSTDGGLTWSDDLAYTALLGCVPCPCEAGGCCSPSWTTICITGAYAGSYIEIGGGYYHGNNRFVKLLCGVLNSGYSLEVFASDGVTILARYLYNALDWDCASTLTLTASYGDSGTMTFGSGPCGSGSGGGGSCASVTLLGIASGASDTTLTLPAITVDAGALLVVDAMTCNGTDAPLNITWGGNAMSPVATQGSTHSKVQTRYYVNTGGTTTADVVLTYSVANACQMAVRQVTGTLSNLLSTSGVGTGTASNPTVSVTASAAACIYAIGAIGLVNPSGSLTPDSPFASEGQDVSQTIAGKVYKLTTIYVSEVMPGGTVTAKLSSETPDEWAEVLAVFK